MALFDYDPLGYTGIPDTQRGESMGMLGGIRNWLSDPRNAQGLAAFGRALAQAGAPSRIGPTWGGGLSEAFAGMTEGRNAYDAQQFQRKFQEMQMRKAEQELNQKADPLAAFGKVDAKDYTPESLQQFLMTRNPSVLRARTKVEVAPSGATFDPYSTPVGQNLGAVAPHDFGGYTGMLDKQGNMLGRVANTVSPNAQLGADVTVRGQNMTDARQGDANNLQKEAQRTQLFDTPVGPLLVDKGTGAAKNVTMGGTAVPGQDALKKQATSKNVLGLLGEAEKYINGATGSYAGAAYDVAAKVVGNAPKGAVAIGQLKAIEGALLANMPRMEGPQSNYDVENYKQAAGQIGDPTVPPRIKQAAVKVIRDIQNRYGGNAGSGVEDPLGIR